MIIPKGFKAVLNVRGIYYEPNKGLFLIKTKKSSRDDKWTTPGGNIDKLEGVNAGLTRVILDEVGTRPVSILDPPMFRRDFLSAKDKEAITLKAYIVKLPLEKELSEKEGTTLTGLAFKYFQIDELLSNKVSMTRSTYEIIYSNNFRMMSRSYRAR